MTDYNITSTPLHVQVTNLECPDVPKKRGRFNNYANEGFETPPRRLFYEEECPWAPRKNVRSNNEQELPFPRLNFDNEVDFFDLHDVDPEIMDLLQLIFLVIYY